MILKFVEVGNGFNWGKVAVGRFTPEEWAEPSRFPGADEASLLAARGWGGGHVFVMDLQTGEGGMFRLGGHAPADLNNRSIWVCPLFEPFLVWLYQRAVAFGPDWWEDLPRVVSLPDAPSAIHGYRRPGHARSGGPVA